VVARLTRKLFVVVRTQTLCDFPDAPGSREGRIRTEPVTSPDMVANLVLTYMDGLPMGTTRVVQLFDRCPLGFSASFGPIQIVKTGFVEEIGMETPFYEYVSGQEGQPRANLPSSGYVRKEHADVWIVGVRLIGPAGGYGGLLGTYSGFFEFGTTRSRSFFERRFNHRDPPAWRHFIVGSI
jgi:hypothetical protein